MIVVVTNMNI